MLKITFIPVKVLNVVATFCSNLYLWMVCSAGFLILDLFEA